jgi:nucleoside-diphosphate-sugar epimerase
VVESAVSFCDIFNLCSGSPARLKDAVMLVRVQANSGIMPEFGAVPYAHDGLFHLEGDNTKFKKTFGWVELTDMQSAICETVEWFRAHGGANQQSAHG